jgi:transketolase
MITRAASGHVGGSMSAVEILVSLYHHIMKHDSQNPKWTERDRFIMGKGHATPVYYAVLSDCGYIPKEDLLGFRRPGSYLQGHPKQYQVKGIEASTGTFGFRTFNRLLHGVSCQIEGRKATLFLSLW